MFGKEYDLLKGIGNLEVGCRIVFDFCICVFSIVEIM